jgi:hypothetical protein
MSRSDEITPGRAAPPLATVALLGAPLLIKGENARGYDELLARICATLQPADSLEEIWIRDVVDLVWETFRLRRMKASMMTDATHREIGATLSTEYTGARETAQKWAAGDAGAAEEIEAALACAGLSMDTVIARAMTSKYRIEKMERLDRMLMSAEARRSAALRELGYHRAPLAQKLRRSIAQAEHAELAVDAPRIAAEPEPA